MSTRNTGRKRFERDTYSYQPYRKHYPHSFDPRVDGLPSTQIYEPRYIHKSPWHKPAKAVTTVVAEVAKKKFPEATLPIEGVKLLTDTVIDKTLGESVPSGKFVAKARTKMVRRRNNSNRKKKRLRPRRSASGYMRAEAFRIKCIVPWADMSGTKGKWYYNFKLDSLATAFKTVYDEFKLTRMSVKYLPNNTAGDATGLYSMVLMDQKGFGSFGAASEMSWFKTLGSMPGSIVKHRASMSRLTWRPTEPDSRNWRSYQRNEMNYVVATVYMADNGQETGELGGAFEVTGTCLGRGRYYNVPTAIALRQIKSALAVDEGLSLDNMALGDDEGLSA